MNTKAMVSFFKKTAVTASVGVACGAIGFVEGAISGSTGAAILGNAVTEAAKMGAVGVGALGLAEGFILGGLAVNGIFGSYEEMKNKGFKNMKDRLFGYVGYTGNQILGGVTAGLFLKVLSSNASFGQIVTNVAVGASITGIVITPIVTICAAMLLDAAYHLTKEEDVGYSSLYQKI